MGQRRAETETVWAKDFFFLFFFMQQAKQNTMGSEPKEAF